MKNSVLALLFLAGMTLGAQAQPQPSLSEMRAALSASMAQTNAIRDLHIQAEVKAGVLAEENAKLKAQLEASKGANENK